MVIGPEYPLVSRIKNYYIKHIMIKSPKTISQKKVKQTISLARENYLNVTRYRPVIVQFDVDPL